MAKSVHQNKQQFVLPAASISLCIIILLSFTLIAPAYKRWQRVSRQTSEAKAVVANVVRTQMTQMNPLLKSIGVTIGSPPTVRCEISDPEYPYYQCGTSASVHIDAIQVRTDAGNTLLALTGLDNQLSKMGWRKDDASLPPSPTLLAHTLDESGLTLEYTYYHSGIHCQLAFTIGQHPQASTNWQPVQSLYCDKNVPR